MSVFDTDNYVSRLAQETHRTFAFRATNRDELLHWQRAFRPRLRAHLGLPRIAERGPCDLDPQQAGETELETHIREEWTIQSEPGFRLPFFVLRPKRQNGRRPLVLTPHGHNQSAKLLYAGIVEDELGREQMLQGERNIAVQAVEDGYVAIAPDMRGFGPLRRKKERDENKNNSCRAHQLHALLFGRTLVGERVWDIGRLIDYAATRSEIDSGRIMITGNSGGGTISTFAAACDERITLAVPSCYYCTFEHSIAGVHHCECNYVPGIMALGEMYDVAGLIAPRPFMAVAGREDDLFPIAWVQFAYEKLRRVYDVAGVPERCRLSIGEGGHRFYKKDVWPFAKEML